MLLFVFIIQFVVSSGLSQTGNDIDNVNNDIDSIQAQTNTNTTNITTLQGQNQYTTASSNTTSFNGNVNVSGQLIVGTTDVVKEITNLESTVNSQLYETTDLTLENLTVQKLYVCNGTTSSSFFDSTQGIAFIFCPVGYVIETEESEDINKATIPGYWAILATQGRFPEPAQNNDHSYMINPGFSIVIWTDKYFTGYSIGPYTNATTKPLFAKAGSDNDQKMKSIVAYYKGVIWNPMGYAIPGNVPTNIPYP